MSANIRTALDATAVSVKDVYGDGRHVTIHVVADAFDGKSTMNRQRMVYKVREEGVGWGERVGISLHGREG
eukprot:238515-Chlamydomonas_euryale.AAC.1